MTTLKNLKGTAIQFLDADPVVYAGAWSSGGTMNTATLRGGGVGTQTAALSIAGVVNPDTVSGKTESYNGTAWTELGDLNTTRYIGNFVFGTQTAAIGAGGATGGPGTPTVAVVEQWNGSAWTEVGDLNKAKVQGGGSGTTSGGLIFGGFTFPGGPPTFVILAETETWNGSAWTEVNNLNAVRYTNTGSKGGSSTASITFGRATSPTAIVEKWDGTNWTEVGDLNSGRESIGGSGTSTDGLGFGGTPNTTKTEAYNGTSWTEVADLSVGRSQIGGTGASGSSALAFGGATPSESSATEEWSFPSGSIVQEGDMWFNSSSSTLKGYGTAAGVPAGTWGSATSANTARAELASFGIQNAALAAGGDTGSPSALTEIYNGSSWTEVGDLNSARFALNGAGTTTAGIVAAGHDGSNRAYTEVWNGSAWTEVSDVNQARLRAASAKMGTSTDTMIFGGEGPGDRSDTEVWDGSSWTEVAEMNDARVQAMGSGTTAAAICAGGQPGPGSPQFDNAVETWNGSSWTEVSEINTRKAGLAGSGPSTATLIFGGFTPPNTVINETESWNGSAWTELNNLSTSRKELGGAGASSASALAFMGATPSVVAVAEEWTADAAVATVTTS